MNVVLILIRNCRYRKRNFYKYEFHCRCSCLGWDAVANRGDGFSTQGQRELWRLQETAFCKLCIWGKISFEQTSIVRKYWSAICEVGHRFEPRSALIAKAVFVDLWHLPQFTGCLINIFSISFIGWPKRDEVTGGWRKLHNEELHNLYSSPSIIRITSQEGWHGRGM
jgi:hypothetical protein